MKKPPQNRRAPRVLSPDAAGRCGGCGAAGFWYAGNTGFAHRYICMSCGVAKDLKR